MENKTKLAYGIKGKLISAICMLLVAIIMVVSSTYAWFTLSTAPEVTGIQTAIGANGALEMALQTAKGEVLEGTTTSADMTVRNTYWGNLVDLTNGYGLDKIVLNPAALNVLTGGDTLGEILLKTPTYGADGRPGELIANTVTGIIGDDKFAESDQFGVRAVGVASGMTDRQLAYRNAKSEAENAMTAAKNAAQKSLKENGSVLANIAMKHATAERAGSDKYTQDEVDTLKTVVEELEEALGQVETAYKQYILAYAASKAVTVDNAEDAWKAVNTDETLANIKSAINTAGITLPTSVNAGITALENSVKSVNSDVADNKGAKQILEALTPDGEGNYTWAQISQALDKIADSSKMKINGYTVSEAKLNMGEIASAAMGGGGLTLTIASGGGVYADIADQCGDYSADIVIEKIQYNGIEVPNVRAKMQTATSVEPAAYLEAVKNGVAAAGAPDGSAGDVKTITEYYGYVVDLAFRTNAANSNLLLQTESKDRIYSDNTNPETLGKGSTMTFKATESSFTEDKVVNLMKSVRVVFFDTENKKILATAKLDLGEDEDGKKNYDTGADGVTASLYLYKTETEEAEEGGMPTIKETLITDQANAEIIALQQNETKRISALVYLDGENIKNADVAATANQSVTGTMNLQFSSSAELKPMEYAQFHTPSTPEAPAPEAPAEP